jgi:hypothetical protein
MAISPSRFPHPVDHQSRDLAQGDARLKMKTASMQASNHCFAGYHFPVVVPFRQRITSTLHGYSAWNVMSIRNPSGGPVIIQLHHSCGH